MVLLKQLNWLLVWACRNDFMNCDRQKFNLRYYKGVEMGQLVRASSITSHQDGDS